MRVSKTFKAVVAPLLYEKLNWEYMQRNPLKLVKEGNVIKIGSGINTKADDLRHIKYIELQHHVVKECAGKVERGQLPSLEIPIVYIDLTKSSEDNYPNYHYGLDNQRCHLLQFQRADKVVVSVNADHAPTSLRRFRIGSVEEQVVKLKLDFLPNLWRRPYLHSESTANKLVIILSPAAQDTYATTSPYNDQVMRHCMSVWADHLARDSKIRHSSSDIVMVNFDEIENRMVSHPADFAGAFERMCKDTIDRFNPRDYIKPNGQRWRTASEAASVSIKFISMKEYLTNYDWTGIYTKEEVAKLLQAKDLKRDQ